MFDTIIKKECGCDYLSAIPCSHCHENYQRNAMREQVAFDRGYAKGKRDGFETAMDDYVIRFRSMDEQEKYVHKLKEALRPLEELKKELGIE